jgi:hypothetical protein
MAASMPLEGDRSRPGPFTYKAKARSIAAGGAFFVARNAPHWEGARGDTLIIGVGVGPWKTTEISGARAKADAGWQESFARDEFE